MVMQYDRLISEEEYLTLGVNIGTMSMNVASYIIPKIARIGQVINVSVSALDMGYFGLFTFPDRLSIFPYSMLANIPLELIPENLVFTLTHEMMHSRQVIDNEMYDTNNDYFKMIEDSADMEAIEFIKANKTELESIIGIEINIDRIKASNLFNEEEKIYNYQKMSLLYYYYKLIHPFVYMVGFYDVYGVLTENDNIILEISDNETTERHPIKEDGKFKYYQYMIVLSVCKSYGVGITMDLEIDSITENGKNWQYINIHFPQIFKPTLIKF